MYYHHSEGLKHFQHFNVVGRKFSSKSSLTLDYDRCGWRRDGWDACVRTYVKVGGQCKRNVNRNYDLLWEYVVDVPFSGLLLPWLLP